MRTPVSRMTEPTILTREFLSCTGVRPGGVQRRSSVVRFTHRAVPSQRRLSPAMSASRRRRAASPAAVVA